MSLHLPKFESRYIRYQYSVILRTQQLRFVSAPAYTFISVLNTITIIKPAREQGSREVLGLFWALFISIRLQGAPPTPHIYVLPIAYLNIPPCVVYKCTTRLGCDTPQDHRVQQKFSRDFLRKIPYNSCLHCADC